MVTASQLRPGMAIAFEQQLYKVLAADYHPGQGRMGGVTHSRLLNLETGTQWEQNFRSDLKLDDLPVLKAQMDFLYNDADHYYFMSPETFEQVAVPASMLGPPARFLQPGLRVSIEFVNDRPVNVMLPDAVEARVADTSAPLHQQQELAWKTAKLDNEAEVLVPPFIKTGDLIRVDLRTLKYMDRVKGASRS